MGKIELIKDLVEFLNKASDAYYNTGDTIISDHDFDRHIEDLRRLEKETGFVMASSPTQRVGYEVKSQLEKVQHNHPMLSLDKTKSLEDIVEFVGDHAFVAMPKMDGLTCSVRYVNGQLVSAETRGNGEIGESVLHCAKVIKNLPLQIDYKGELIVDGEVIISDSDFREINSQLPEDQKYKNSRNLVSGSIRQLDSRVAAQRNMKFIVWKCVAPINIEESNNNSFAWRLSMLHQLGFEVVQHFRWELRKMRKLPAYKPFSDAEILENIVYQIQSWAEQRGYPLDGCVFGYDDVVYGDSLGSTGHHLRSQIAFKFGDEIHETTLVDVEWNTTRSGLISPVAVFEEVNLDGALTTRATLHNLSVIKQLELGIGDTITIYRSNMVIPKIDDNLTRSNTLVIPDKCPCCGAATIVKDTENSQVLMCSNPNCQAKKLAQFTHFVSRNCMNIDGLSEAKLDRLISLDYIKEFSDIYVLSDHYEELIKIEGFGPKSVKNLLLSIENSRNVKLEHFLNALGIPNIGLSAAKTISKYFNGDINQLITAHMDCFEWEILDDFGAVMANSIDDYLLENINMVQALANEMNFIIEKQEEITVNPFNGKIIAVTGKLNHFTRNSINEKIESLGAKAASSVTTKTDFLLTNEASGSSKYKKAVELGINIITENQFINMIGG